MVQIPRNSRIYYSYSEKLIFTLYGKVGQLLKVIQAKDSTEFKKLEKQFNSYFFADITQAVTKTRLQIYQQYNLKNKLIREYTYQDILDSDLSFDNIRRSVNLGLVYKDHYWKAKNNIEEQT